MIRKTLGILAILVVVGGGKVFATGWPSGGGGPGQPGCASCGGDKIGGWVDNSPLYGELTYWTFQRSNCRQLHGQGGHYNQGTGEIPYFPPLPYSHKAQGYRGPAQVAPPTSPAPAVSPAPAAPAAPPTSPAPPAPPAGEGSQAQESVWGDR